METDESQRRDANTDATDLAVDLRVLAGLRSRSAVRDRVLPTVDAHLGDAANSDREARFAALQDLIDTSIDRMADPAHRSAAAELLGAGPHRWQPLTRRGPRAASAFHLGWDAYRRRRDATGASLLEETLDELAATILRDRVDDRGGRSGSPSTSPADTPAPAASTPSVIVEIVEPDRRPPPPEADSSPTPEPPTGRRTRVVAAAAAAGLIAVLAVVVVARMRTDPAAETGSACGTLVMRPGDAAPDAPPAITRWSEPFRDAATERLPDAGCAAAIGTRGGSVFQQVSTSGSAEAWLLLGSATSGDVLVLNPLEHHEYRESVWASGEAVPAGPAVAQDPERDDGTRAIRLANGVLAQSHEHDRAFVIIDRFHELWTELGGFDGELGAPMSNRYERPGAGSTQDFAYGRLVASYEDGGGVTLEPYEASDLIVPSDLPGQIVRTPAGDNWFVTRAGQRRWLPTADDVTCASEAHGSVVVDGSAGVVAALPVGPVFRCA